MNNSDLLRREFDPNHPLYELFLKFHTGKVPDAERWAAKRALMPIHYSASYDMRSAWAAVEEARKARTE